jgi:hypothetical protein
MNSLFRRPAGLLTIACALFLAACSHGPTAKVQPVRMSPQMVAGEVDMVAALLDNGETEAARTRVDAALLHDPQNPLLLMLRDSMILDPQELLGPRSYAYTVREGETMSVLAQRFLGNRLKAYQLARYNNIARPADLGEGHVLQIPGEAARAEPARRADAAPARSTDASARPATPSAAATASRAPAANPAAAQQARAAGLAALNSGDVSRAVGLLRRAAALEPSNKVIAGDLVRAERIAATVRARK